MHSQKTLTTNPKPTHNQLTHTQQRDSSTRGPVRMTSEELRETRKLLGISMRTLAKICGLSDHMLIWHWETGNKRIPLYISLLIRLVGVIKNTRLGERMGL